MATVTLDWHGDEWMQTVGIPAAQAAITHAADVGAQIARKSLGTDHGGTVSKPFNPPNTQTNNLRRSIRSAGPDQTGKPLTAQIGTNVLYARVLEFGGTIRAKGKLLVIPINDAAKKLMNQSKGSGRAALNTMKARYKGKRSGKRTVFLRSKGGGIVVGVQAFGTYTRGKKKGTVLSSNILDIYPKFLLTKRVTIQARPFLRPLIHNPDNKAVLARAAQVAFASAVARLSRGKGRAAA